MEYSKIKMLSFDCYGTLIDWQKSVQDILEPFLNQYGIAFSREEIFEAFLRADQKLEADKYLTYREILAEIVMMIADDFRISIDPSERYILSERFGEWLPFSDTIESLKLLRQHYRLAILSNVDDELFFITNKLLDVEFDCIVTAEQLESYKPDRNNFLKAGERFGLETEERLHVAQSIYHDIVPANELDWNTAWVNRYNEPERTDPKEYPDLEVPDLTSLVKILRMESGMS